MTKEVFLKWADRVKDTVYQNIKRRMYMTGEFPAAIIAGGECQYVFMDNPMEIQYTSLRRKRAEDGNCSYGERREGE